MTAPHPFLIDSRIERRESNLELLRIVAMSMILWIHFFRYAGPVYATGTFRITETFCIYAVDLYVLISGWFTIRTTWRSVIRLWLYTLFFIVAVVCGHLAITGTPPGSWQAVRNAVFAPFSDSHLWFLGVYFALMVLAPVLNRGIRGISLHDMRLFILALTFLEFYSDYLFNNSHDKFGVSLYNFIYLYYLGRYLREEPWIKKIPTWSLFLAAAALIAAYCTSELYFLLYRYEALETFTHYTIRHNSPLVVGVSALLVLFFSRLQFHSKAVNYVASASLGCYIIQEGLWNNDWYTFLQGFVTPDPPVFWFGKWLLMASVAFLAIWGISTALTLLSRLFIPRLADAIEGRIPGWLKPERRKQG